MRLSSGSKLAGNVIEDQEQICSDQLKRDDRDKRNQDGNQAIFDRGGPTIVLDELDHKVLHQRLSHHSYQVRQNFARVKSEWVEIAKHFACLVAFAPECRGIAPRGTQTPRGADTVSRELDAEQVMTVGRRRCPWRRRERAMVNLVDGSGPAPSMGRKR